MSELLCEQMQVVVLMGGLGTRLKNQTKNCPKPLLEVCGKPFFEYQLTLLRLAGFRKFLFCVGYHAEMIASYFGDGSQFGVEITYSYDGEKLLGTGGAVRNALPMLNSDFILIYGDSFMDINYFEVVVRYFQGRRTGKKALMTVMRNRDQFDKSNVICKGGEILLYDKQSHSADMSYIDYGVNVFSRGLFEVYPSGSAFDLSALQNELSRQKALACCEVEQRFYEIGSPSSLLEFSDYAQRRWYVPSKAVFLDRDGVINGIVWNEDAEQLDSPLKREQFRLLPGVPEALKILQKKGYLLFVATNQPAAAKGKTTYTELCAINHMFVQSMRECGVEITEVTMCPHYEHMTSQTAEKYLAHACDCRKPKTGLIQQIKAKYKIDLEHSWMAGDSYTDIVCGQNAGLHTAFIGKYKCDLCMMLNGNKPDKIYPSLKEFAEGLPYA